MSLPLKTEAGPAPVAPGPALASDEAMAALIALPVPAWIADASGFIHWYNEAWYETTGTTPEQMLGWGWQSVHDPAVLPMVLSRWARSIATGEPFEMVFPLRVPDGRYVPHLTRIRPVKDSEGIIWRWIGVNVAVNDLTRTAEELAEEKLGLKTLNDVAVAVAAERDFGRLVQIVTDAGVALTGARFAAFFHNVETEEGDAYRLYTLSGAPYEAFARFGMPRITRLFAPTFSGRGAVRCADILTEPRAGDNPPYNGLPPGHLPVRAYLAVPVVSRTGTVFGSLLFGHPEPDRFHQRHEDLARGIAAHAAIALENTRLHQAAQQEIEERKAAEVQRQVLIRELNHRVKNLFAVASAMVAMTARSAATVQDMARAIRGRMTALARAHELIQPMLGDQPGRAPAVDLQHLLRVVLGPHLPEPQPDSDQPGRLSLLGPQILLGSAAVPVLALVFHEWATNAIKYGALSRPEGRIAVTWTLEPPADLVLLRWIEIGGPVLDQAPASGGFGTQLTTHSITGQLGGTLDWQWQADGLTIEARLPLDRLRQ